MEDPPSAGGKLRVEKGILNSSGPAVSHLFSARDDYKDFHLRVEARINDGGVGGVYIRAPFDLSLPEDNPSHPPGYRIHISTSRPRKTGSLFILPGGATVTRSHALHQPDQWFTLEVIAEGNHVIVKVNGTTTVDYIDEKRLYSSGHVVLQQNNPEAIVGFRKIEIKELNTSSKSARDSQRVTTTVRQTRESDDPKPGSALIGRQVGDTYRRTQHRIR